MKKKKSKSNIKTVLVKLLLVTLLSLCLSALFTTITSSLLSGITLAGILIAVSANLAVLTREGGITEVAWATSATYGIFFLLTIWVYHKEVQQAASSASV